MWNIETVTGACKLIDGCSLALCSATVSEVSAGLDATEIKSIQLHDFIEGLSQRYYLQLRTTTTTTN